MYALKNPLDGLEDDTKNKKIEIAQRVLQSPGIDLRVKDVDGKSALDFARYEGCPPEITQLIQNCIRSTILNLQGNRQTSWEGIHEHKFILGD